MPVAVGLDEHGAPTAALAKKLASLGADASVVPALERDGQGKGESLFLRSTLPGATLAEGLQKALADAVAKLPIPKLMQYQLHRGQGPGFQPGWTSVHFVRPAHGLVALHGTEVVAVSVLGLHAGRMTRGHRFEAGTDPIELRSADSYARQLSEPGAAIASLAARRAEIERQLRDAAAAWRAVDAHALLDEVTALVER